MNARPLVRRLKRKLGLMSRWEYVVLYGKPSLSGRGPLGIIIVGKVPSLEDVPEGRSRFLF